MGYQPLTAIEVDGVSRRILSRRSAGNGYTAIKVDDPNNPGVPVAEFSVPSDWLDNPRATGGCITSGHKFSKPKATPPGAD